MDPETFERKRLELFELNGFKGRTRRIPDRLGREVYLIERAGRGPPTVLVHGGLSEVSMWALLAGKLPGHVIIPDRPGFGLSYQIDYSGVDFRGAAIDWLLDLLDGLEADEVDLVGNSIGGFFAILFALAHPQRVRRLVLIGAIPGLHQSLPLFPRLWGNPITGPLISRMRISDPEVYRARVFGSILVAQPEKVPSAMLELAVAATALPGVDRTSYTMLRAVSTLRGWRRQLMLRDEVQKLSVPVLFIWGDADAFAPPSVGQEMARKMSDARIEILPDAGHLAHVDRPDAVAALMREFLSHEGNAGGPGPHS